jgi:hypothetical protein
MRTRWFPALPGIGAISPGAPAFGQKLYPVKGPPPSQPTPPVFPGPIRDLRSVGRRPRGWHGAAVDNQRNV